MKVKLKNQLPDSAGTDESKREMFEGYPVYQLNGDNKNKIPKDTVIAKKDPSKTKAGSVCGFSGTFKKGSDNYNSAGNLYAPEANADETENGFEIEDEQITN